MVNINDILNGAVLEEELNKISMDLPNHFFLNFLGSTKYGNRYSLSIIPRTYPLFVGHVLHLGDNGKTSYGMYIPYSQYHTKIEMFLDDIEDDCDCLDVFGNITELGMIDEMILSFEDHMASLFGYMKQNFRNENSYFLGSIARVEDKRWKFYPKFTKCKCVSDIMKDYAFERYLQ